MSDQYDAKSFVDQLEKLRPQSKGTILLGIQHENGSFSPVPFTGSVPPDATHINTGLFHQEEDGQWYEKGHLVDAVMCLVLDDQGNPEKTSAQPGLEPTCKIWTSEGSEQWVYVYNQEVDPAAGKAMAVAAAGAGLSDEFISNRHHHWWRLPGSLPAQKVQQGRTENARLIEFSDQTYGYTDLAKGLNIEPEKVELDHYAGSAEFDPDSALQDPLLTWLRENGRVGRNFDTRGFVEVLCPNSAEHSDTNRPYARYVPPNRKSEAGFTCHHAHCNGSGGKKITLQHLRESAEQEGGPTVAKTREYSRVMREVRDKAIITDFAKLEEELARMREVLPGFRKAVIKTDPAEDPFSTVALRKVKLERRPPLIENLIAPHLTYFSGDPKAGKSFVAMQLAEAIETGKDIWGCPVPEKRRVLYYAAENGYEETVARIQQMKLDGDTQWRFKDKHFEKLPESVEELLSMLTRECLNDPTIDVVILDTLRFLSGAPKATQGNAQDRDFAQLLPIQSWSQKHRIAVIAVAHTNKPTDGRNVLRSQLASTAGSNLIAGTAESILTLTRRFDKESKNPTDDAVLQRLGRSFRQDGNINIVFDRDSARFVEMDDQIKRLVSQIESTRSGSARMSILQELRNRPDGTSRDRLRNMITKTTNVSRQAVYNAIQKLIGDGLVERFEHQDEVWLKLKSLE